MSTYILQLKEKIQPLQGQLLNHPINTYLNSFEELKKFMQIHSFAVWDFMSLVKKLQAEFTCVTLPWKPVGNPQTRRLINEIVFGEESDVDQHGQPLSHFELYVSAMRNLDIPVLPELNLLLKTNSIEELLELIPNLNLDDRVKNFLFFTFESIQNKAIHEIAAIFTFGREDLIPAMFTKIVSQLKNDSSKSINELIYYLDRHIEVDGDSHSHLAYEMMEELCGSDEKKWIEAQDAAIESLKNRLNLWDAIIEA